MERVKCFEKSGQVLKEQGIFLKRSGDLLKAIDYLNKKRIIFDVLDTEFAFLIQAVEDEKSQSVISMPDICAKTVVSNWMNNKTLHKVSAYSGSKSMRKATSWETLLRMNACGEVFSRLEKCYGLKEAKQRNQPSSQKYQISERKLQEDYEFASGIFFQNESDIKEAYHGLIHELGLDAIRLSTETALVTFYLKDSVKEKAVGELYLLEVGSSLTNENAFWKKLLKDEIKKILQVECTRLVKLELKKQKKLN